MRCRNIRIHVEIPVVRQHGNVFAIAVRKRLWRDIGFARGKRKAVDAVEILVILSMGNQKRGYIVHGNTLKQGV